MWNKTLICLKFKVIFYFLPWGSSPLNIKPPFGRICFSCSKHIKQIQETNQAISVGTQRMAVFKKTSLKQRVTWPWSGRLFFWMELVLGHILSNHRQVCQVCPSDDVGQIIATKKPVGPKWWLRIREFPTKYPKKVRFRKYNLPHGWFMIHHWKNPPIEPSWKKAASLQRLQCPGTWFAAQQAVFATILPPKSLFLEL